MSTLTLTYREALGQALREELDRDQRVILLGEDIGAFDGAFKVTKGLLADYGEARIRDTPNAEATIVGVGIGAAMAGLRPVVELMTITGVLRALDQLLVGAAQARFQSGGQLSVPLVVRTPQGSGHQLGPTHSHSLESLLLGIPGLLVATPSTAADAKGLLKSAIRDPNPVVVIEHESLYSAKGEVPEGEHLVPFGEAVIRRPGRDLTILGISRGAVTAVEAADVLEREHAVSAEVIDPRTLRPLDLPTILESVSRTNRLLIVEEGWPQGGVGATIAALVTEHAFDDLDGPVMRVTGADAPVAYSRVLERAGQADARAVALAAL
ncbi:MAG: alpha-ketoacid dehydrogenase subunit beta, partial [Solirubrobacteraceae bacterium]|nr:alpha-ketoacid dehydrogenase subunit beta [Solirubrobacteraceae bacterium]